MTTKPRYSIEPDKVVGRIFWTDLGHVGVSSIDNRIRAIMSPMARMRDALFPPTQYETAVCLPTGVIVIAHHTTLK